MHEGEPRSRAGIAGCTFLALTYVAAMLALVYLGFRWLMGVLTGA